MSTELKRLNYDKRTAYFMQFCFAYMLFPTAFASRHLNCLRVFQSQFLHILFTHHKFLNLVSVGHRKRRDKFDVMGDFVVCDFAATEGLEFC